MARTVRNSTVTGSFSEITVVVAVGVEKKFLPDHPYNLFKLSTEL